MPTPTALWPRLRRPALRWYPGSAAYLAYRLADYVVLNLGEDAAMLAFMFC